MLPSHRFAAGAEEKIVRVFESTKNFLQNLSNLSKVDVSDEYSKKVCRKTNYFYCYFCDIWFVLNPSNFTVKISYRIYFL